MISVSKSVFRICTIFHQLFNVQKVETENILLLECMILGGLFTLDRTPSPQQSSYCPRQNVFEHTLIQLVEEEHLIWEYLHTVVREFFQYGNILKDLLSAHFEIESFLYLACMGFPIFAKRLVDG